jgi:hypothetical protein
VTTCFSEPSFDNTGSVALDRSFFRALKSHRRSSTAPLERLWTRVDQVAKQVQRISPKMTAVSARMRMAMLEFHLPAERRYSIGRNLRCNILSCPGLPLILGVARSQVNSTG